MSHLNAIRPIGLANGPSPLEEIDRAYSDLEVVVARPERALWCYLKPQARPSFTEALLRTMQATPSSEYLLVEPDGSVYGVLVTADVDAAFTRST